MKYFIFIIWLILTVLLGLSLIGWIVLFRSNNTSYWMSEEENRTMWMKIGYVLLQSILKNNQGKP